MKDAHGKEIPNPGSNEALKAGCFCPVSDNNHGRGRFWPGCVKPVFWINNKCPIHGTMSLFESLIWPSMVVVTASDKNKEE
jgi:hypothetical protein